MARTEAKSASATSRSILGSLFFLCMVTRSSYTANLASNLVNENKIIEINVFEDVLSLNLNVCLVRTFPLEIELRKKYPTGNYVLKETEQEVFTAVSSGDCAIGVTDYSSFKLYDERKEYSNCNLEWVGRRVATNMGSFAIKDSKDYCTNLLYNTLNIHLLEMADDGTMAEIWKKKETRYQECNDNDNSNKEGKRLYIKDIGGVFLFHYAILVISVVTTFCICKNKNTDASSDDKEEIQRKDEHFEDNNLVSSLENREGCTTALNATTLTEVKDSQNEMISEMKRSQNKLKKSQLDMNDSQTKIESELTEVKQMLADLLARQSKVE